MSNSNNLTYLGLGSNLKNPEQQLQNAIALLAQLPNTEICQISSFYHNKALIHPDRPYEIQPDFSNAVIALKTKFNAFELLEECLKIESQLGRTRTTKNWEARIIDIDILLYGNQIINSEKLIIPHPEIYNRIFVLQPLTEIAPDLCFPDGTKLASVLNIFNRRAAEDAENIL